VKLWQQWIHRPQKTWLRKALFQVHLWSGIALGLYVFVICVSGSAAVFNNELYTVFLPSTPKVASISGTRMTRAEIKAAAERAHPGLTVTRVLLLGDPHYAASASFGASTFAPQRFIDPYTGRDIGNARPFGLRMVSFFSQLHMNLLMDYRGRQVNGVGGALVAFLSLTGIVIWWPGIRRWRDSLNFRLGSSFARVNWSLHSAIGFWTFGIVFMWAVTGAYLVYPRVIEDVLSRASGHVISLGQLPHSIHVGNFAGWPIKALWVLLGLAPPMLFLTGSIMWWKRVLRPWVKQHIPARSPKHSPRAIPARVFEADAVRSVAASRSADS
jgi:uncharacterized iron-regulated membrane protein